MSSPAVESLGAEELSRVLRDYPPGVREQAAGLLRRLAGDVEAQKARLSDLEPALKSGDPDLGRTVFFGNKAGCTACHTVGGRGGKVGPELTKIGAIRSGRDLLESIVFPSATFVRGYEPYVVKTRDGSVLNGIVARETAEAIFLYDAERIERRVLRSAILDMRQGRVSIMPQGLDAVLSRDELASLVVFLQSLR
jgi:putative heme-binding domain-containing protein